jgi:hypothetical protein
LWKEKTNGIVRAVNRSPLIHLAALFFIVGAVATGAKGAGLAKVQSGLALSEDLAHVTEASAPSFSGIPDYILVQDVHNHPEVQERIAKIILQAYSRWDVRKVFLEGAFNTVDLSVFESVPKETRTALLRRLIQDGDLSGPELAAVWLMESNLSDRTHGSPFQLIGMEDARVYRRNLDAFRQIQQQRETGLQELTILRNLQNSVRLGGPNVFTAQLDRTEALIRLKLTPADYAAYLKARDAVPSSPGLDPARKAAESFYELVDSRSDIFLNQAERKVPASTGPRLLVVGGFHTVRMAETLRRQGRTFVVLTPHITAGGNEPLYERRLMESISALQIVRPFNKSLPHPTNPAADHLRLGR